MTRRYLVTGGAGFIGSNFIRWIFGNTDDVVVTNLDALTYAGVPATVEQLDRDARHTFVHGDIRDRDLLGDILPGYDVVVHFAAESHVDRSIDGPSAFLETNVVGTGTLIDVAVDLRRSSPTFGDWMGVTLNGEDGSQMWIPEGFAHGFLALSDNVRVTYKVTDFYAPECQRTIGWNDETIGIDWPLDGIDRPILSTKDADAPGLRTGDLLE
jgi:hypothetical protein